MVPSSRKKPYLQTHSTSAREMVYRMPGSGSLLISQHLFKEIERLSKVADEDNFVFSLMLDFVQEPS